jgi:hypothetical protein
MDDLIPVELLVGAVVLIAFAIGVTALWSRFNRRDEE